MKTQEALAADYVPTYRSADDIVGSDFLRRQMAAALLAYGNTLTNGEARAFGQADWAGKLALTRSGLLSRLEAVSGKPLLTAELTAELVHLRALEITDHIGETAIVQQIALDMGATEVAPQLVHLPTLDGFSQRVAESVLRNTQRLGHEWGDDQPEPITLDSLMAALAAPEALTTPPLVATLCSTSVTAQPVGTGPIYGVNLFLSVNSLPATEV